MTEEQTVQIAEARGRPMLHWVGKRPLSYVTAFPAQKVETFNPTNEQNEAQGLLFHGDNKDVLAWLLANGYRGTVDLIYIDPPFDSGADYVRRVDLRRVSIPKLEGEAHSLGEQIQYTDIWANDMYLQFMYERFLLIKELLSDGGSVYVHCDWRMNSYLRVLMDEVFGEDKLRAEIKWKRVVSTGSSKAISKKYPVVDDSILFYVKSEAYTWNTQYKEFSEEYKQRYDQEDERGRFYWDNLGTYSEETLQRLIEEDRVRLPLVEGKNPRYKNYLHERKGVVVDNLWTDITPINSQAIESLDFPTQKPEALVKRILRASSNPGDLVLDCFVGSGTTAAVAQQLGRRWIAADINKGAIQTTSKRLQTILRAQIQAGTEPHQVTMDLDERAGETLPPAALSFSVYRVNDYDLQIQHNEAINLAVEHIGIERTKTDTYFDGTLGNRLVKIVPFNHPLTLLDLQALKDEVEARKDERDIVVVCLGKETTVDPWLADYNKNRPINKIEVIELRTDHKYGKFFVHQPAQAQVDIRAQDGKILVEIEDFISPTIVERLEMDTPIFKAKIADWRAMVDCVLIDLDYDGEVFDIDLSDVPERKDDLVDGRYELDAPDRETTVAVKIVDMLGEEVLVTQDL